MMDDLQATFQLPALGLSLLQQGVSPVDRDKLLGFHIRLSPAFPHRCYSVTSASSCENCPLFSFTKISLSWPTEPQLDSEIPSWALQLHLLCPFRGFHRDRWSTKAQGVQSRWLLLLPISRCGFLYFPCYLHLKFWISYIKQTKEYTRKVEGIDQGP